MAGIRVVFFQTEKGRVPVLEWLQTIEKTHGKKPVAKCRDLIARLSKLGHNLGRPHAGHLGDEIFELRARYKSVRYRVFYFFHGKSAVVLSHGAIKGTRKVRKAEIERAKECRRRFLADPERHTYGERVDHG